MRVNTRVVDRRAQILEATVEVIASRGVHETSFARIIEHAGLSSTRLISYHFESRDVLLQEALAYVLDEAARFMGPRIAQATTANERLSAYIRSNLEFVKEWPAGARAAIDIIGVLTPPADEPEAMDTSVVLLEQLFVAGQAAGEFGAFDPAMMAMNVRACIDALVLRSTRSELDLDRNADELVLLFSRATRSDDDA